MSKKLARNIALVILLVPISFLLLFTFGEIFSGDISGLSHLIQLAPIIIVLIVALKKPLIGGALFSVISALFGILYLVTVPFNPITILIVELVLFLPPFIAGLLFIYSARLIDKKIKE